MRDVASAAGVSLKTVSRVVNGERHVSADKVERVERAVRDLGYRVDDRASRLRKGDGGTGTIGFVLQDVANDFFSSILRGLEEVAAEHGLLVIAGSTDGDVVREQVLVDAFVRRRVDGLVAVLSELSAASLQAELDRRLPIVLVDLEPPGAPTDVVRSDHHAGGVLATRHLLEHGHRDIAFLGDEDIVFSASERFRGYAEALAAEGIEPRPGWVERHRLPAAGWADVAAALLDRDPRPTAVFAAQNFVTLGLVQTLHERGLQHEVAVVGHDDVPFATVVDPAITVVPQRPREIGRIAAERLLARIAGDEGPPERHLLDPEIIPRGSGELPGPHLPGA